MTTIAYKDGVIACDSRITSGSLIVDDNEIKMVKKGDVVFFLAGSTSDYLAFIDAYISGASVDKDSDCAALVIDKGMVYFVSDEEGKLFKCPAKQPYSIGSGSKHAITAMDMGATASEAVKIAMKRDASTGGKVRTYKVAPSLKAH